MGSLLSLIARTRLFLNRLISGKTVGFSRPHPTPSSFRSVRYVPSLFCQGSARSVPRVELTPPLGLCCSCQNPSCGIPNRPVPDFNHEVAFWSWINQSHSRHIPSLCLLSRGSQGHAVLCFQSCFGPLKAMIALVRGSARLQHYCATYQPECQEVPLPRHFLPPRSIAKRLSAVPNVGLWFRNRRTAHCSDTARPFQGESLSSWLAASCLGWLPDVFPATHDSTVYAHQLLTTYACPHSRIRHDSPSNLGARPLSAADRTTLDPSLDDPRPAFESRALTPSASSTNLSVASSPNSSSDDAPLCLVCDTPSCNSCPACEQDFCEMHLYLCADCGNQYCGKCLDEHHAEGHWTDSATAAELDHAQRLYSERAACSHHCGVNSPTAQNQSTAWLSVRAIVARFISLFSSMSRLVGVCLSCCSAIAPTYVPQRVLLPEVTL